MIKKIGKIIVSIIIGVVLMSCSLNGTKTPELKTFNLSFTKTLYPKTGFSEADLDKVDIFYKYSGLSDYTLYTGVVEIPEGVVYIELRGDELSFFYWKESDEEDFMQSYPINFQFNMDEDKELLIRCVLC